MTYLDFAPLLSNPRARNFLHEQIPIGDQCIPSAEEILVPERAYFTGFPAAFETARWLGVFDSSDLVS
jgi:hypothetical protein